MVQVRYTIATYFCGFGCAVLVPSCLVTDGLSIRYQYAYRTVPYILWPTQARSFGDSKFRKVAPPRVEFFVSILYLYGTVHNSHPLFCGSGCIDSAVSLDIEFCKTPSIDAVSIRHQCKFVQYCNNNTVSFNNLYSILRNPV